MKRPNIIFYFSDQQRWDTLGCYGQRLPVTPNLDRLASDGVRFANAFTCQPVCGPARACLQTGLYATENGCITNAVSLRPDPRNLACLFDGAGYDTAYVGKWHLASDHDGESYATASVPVSRRGGYRYWMAADVLEFTSHGYGGYVYDTQGNRVDFDGYRADAINGFALDYLRARPKDRPFFLFVSHIEPHHQNDRGVFEGPEGSRERFADYTPPEDLVGTGGDWARNYPDYLGQCNSLDENVGRLLRVLEEEGIRDDTVVLYASDHGCHFRTRTQCYKRSCHESSIHVPLIVSGAGIPRGVVAEPLVSLIDLPPTLLSLAGIRVPDAYQGRSLLPLFGGECPAHWQDDVFLQISEDEIGRAVRTRDWKYAVRGEGDAWKDACSDVYREEYLYDLARDPHERVNLVADARYADVRARLAQRLRQRIRSVEGRDADILPALHR